MTPVSALQNLAPFDRRNVLRDGDALAVFRQFLGGLLALFGLPRRDVDARAVLKKPARDHLADAARPAGDERGAVGEGEEGFHFIVLRLRGPSLRRAPVGALLRMRTMSCRNTKYPHPQEPRSGVSKDAPGTHLLAGASIILSDVDAQRRTYGLSGSRPVRTTEWVDNLPCELLPGRGEHRRSRSAGSNSPARAKTGRARACALSSSACDQLDHVARRSD